MFFLWFTALCRLGLSLWKASVRERRDLCLNEMQVWKKMNLTVHPYWASLKKRNFPILCKLFPVTMNSQWKKKIGSITLLSIFWKDIKRTSFIKSCKGMKTLPTTKINGWNEMGTDLFWQEFQFDNPGCFSLKCTFWGFGINQTTF